MPSRFRKRLRSIARVHFWVLFFSFALYLLMGFSLGPSFFVSDLSKKIKVLADDIITVVAVVVGPPEKPVVTATPLCLSAVSSIFLNWADDTGTDTWDIDRDSLMLTTGLSASQYSDVTVTAGNTYSYVVTAYGPMGPGTSVSDPVGATALDCESEDSPVTVAIQTVGKKSIDEGQAKVTVLQRRPTITGVTNIPNAIVDILLTSRPLSARVTANANGYFSWTPSVKLKTDVHQLTITVTDPADESRSGTDTIAIRIREEEDEDTKTETSPAPGESFDDTASPSPPPTLHFSVDIDGPADFLYQKDQLSVTVTALKDVFPPGALFHAVLLNEKGGEVLRLPTHRVTSPERAFQISQEIPVWLEPGAYQVRVDGVLGEEVASRFASLAIRAWPLFEPREGLVITYPQMASFIGSLFYSLASLFLLMLLLYIREYVLHLRAVKNVTEYHLGRLGFIPKRKGVKQ